jgi:uncharacterized membrane-anchored protein YitT (DUF2179 family)
MELLIRRDYSHDIFSISYNCHFMIPVGRIILIIQGFISLTGVLFHVPAFSMAMFAR